MTETFRCIRADMHENFDDDGEGIGAWDAEDAAHDYVEKSYSDWSYPKGPFPILVRDDVGVVVEVMVFVEYAPCFHAHEQLVDHPEECNHKYRYKGRCSGCQKDFGDGATTP